jgi:hypothetical protein
MSREISSPAQNRSATLSLECVVFCFIGLVRSYYIHYRYVTDSSRRASGWLIHPAAAAAVVHGLATFLAQ